MFKYLSRFLTYVFYLLIFYICFMNSYGVDIKKRLIIHFFISNKSFNENFTFPRRNHKIKYLNKEYREYCKNKCNHYKKKVVNSKNRTKKLIMHLTKYKNNEDVESKNENKTTLYKGVEAVKNISRKKKKKKKTCKYEQKEHIEKIKKVERKKKNEENIDKNKEAENTESYNEIKEIVKNDKANFINKNETNNFSNEKNEIIHNIIGEEAYALEKNNFKKDENKKHLKDDSIRKKLSDLAKLRWKNEEERRKLLQGKKKFKHSEKTKKLLSYKIKLKWTDEKYREKILEKARIFNQDENTKKKKSLILKEKWKIKEFRDKMLSNRKPFSLERRKKISEIIKQKWKEEDYKQKTLQAIKDNYKKRKLQVGLNPNLNYIQNLMLFKKLGMCAPKIRCFPNIHKEKLRNKKKKKKDKENYKEKWKNIYDSILDKNEFQNSLSYLNKIENLSVSTNL
ncbi:conserved Plasmodium protein, unknown function [Plasmodium relictum]|uniref:Uncharacterized protein n=1 Tax=Plasmodium relictum TaxID=85471 RepID=A0A1J1H4X9_PLARL|nr:conserved Plasmodium protein, unknown function [Plasmodium relictum]CRG99745.1 conserved Plasmodium protein, unknown function [Plasmodium relictum]